MTFAEMIGSLRRFWLVIVAVTVGAVAVATAAATLPETTYEAEATLLAQPDTDRVDFAAVEAVSFLLPSLAELVSTNTFRGSVGETLRPKLPASAVDARADFEPGTGIVHIIGRDAEPARAQRITQAAAVLLGRQTLSSAVVITILDPPELPTAPAGPGTVAYLVGGLVLGLLGGALIAIMLAAAARSRPQQLARATVPARGSDEAAPTEIATIAATADDARRTPADPATPEARDEAAQPAWTHVGLASSGRVSATPTAAAVAQTQAATLRAQPDTGAAAASPLEARLAELGLRVLASIPVKTGAAESTQNGSNHFDDAFRALGRVLATEPVARSQLLVTSARAGAGRTTVAANAAWALATAGASVVAIDADVENPMLHRFLRVPSEPGLTDIARVGPQGVTQRSAVQALSVVPVGGTQLSEAPPTADAVSQLLGGLDGRLMIVDGPPLLDSAGTATLARAAGSIVLVIDAADWRAGEDVAASVAVIRDLGVELLGVVLNRANM